MTQYYRTWSACRAILTFKADMSPLYVGCDAHIHATYVALYDAIVADAQRLSWTEVVA